MIDGVPPGLEGVLESILGIVGKEKEEERRVENYRSVPAPMSQNPSYRCWAAEHGSRDGWWTSVVSSEIAGEEVDVGDGPCA